MVPPSYADSQNREILKDFLAETRESRNWFKQPIIFDGERYGITGRKEINLGCMNGDEYVVGVCNRRIDLAMQDLGLALINDCDWIAIRNSDYTATITRSKTGDWIVSSLDLIETSGEQHFLPAMGPCLFDETSTRLGEVLDRPQLTISEVSRDEDSGRLKIVGSEGNVAVLIEVDLESGLVLRRRFVDDAEDVLIDTTIEIDDFAKRPFLRFDIESTQNLSNPVVAYRGRFQLKQVSDVDSHYVYLSAYGLPEPDLPNPSTYFPAQWFFLLGVAGLGVALWLKLRS